MKILNVTALIAAITVLAACQPSDLTNAASEKSSAPSARTVTDDMISEDPATYCLDNITKFPGLNCSEPYVSAKNGFRVEQFCTTGNQTENALIATDILWDARDEIGVIPATTSIGASVYNDRVSASSGARMGGYEAPQTAFDEAGSVANAEGHHYGIYVFVNDNRVTLTTACQK